MAVKLDYALDLSPESVWLTVTATSQAKADMPYLQEAGDFYALPRYFTRREGLASYLIKYVVSGEGQLSYAGKRYVLQPGQAFFIDCMHLQDYRVSPGADHWHLLWVHFFGPSCPRYYKAFEKQNNYSPVVTLPPSFDTSSLLRQILKLWSGGESSFSNDVLTASMLTTLMTQCILGASAPLDLAAMPDYVTAARAFLMGHFHERVTLDRLSEAVSVNKFYLQKQFKRFTGYSPTEFVQAVRINRAKEMLRTGLDPVSQVASAVGMDNVSHFIAVFKQSEGMTPSVYRNNWVSR
ncbi:MAG: AraC family transcriptional regulator [Clostridiales bacterium]|jgi:AraC-like DNA-binding protein|nr:AraC family transcriptional regulator [Clostridiales bacterium]